MIKVHKPKTIIEAVNDLQQFLECDLYSKFKPEEIVNGKVWVRTDTIKDEEEFYKYLKDHFDLLREQIKELEKSNNGDKN